MCLPEGQGFKEWWVLKKHHPIGSKCQLFTNLWMRKHSLQILLLRILAHCLLPKLYHGHLLEGLLEILLEKDVLHRKAWQFTMRSSQIILCPRIAYVIPCSSPWDMHIFSCVMTGKMMASMRKWRDTWPCTFFLFWHFLPPEFPWILPPEFPRKNVSENTFFLSCHFVTTDLVTFCRKVHCLLRRLERGFLTVFVGPPKRHGEWSWFCQIGNHSVLDCILAFFWQALNIIFLEHLRSCRQTFDDPVHLES